MTDNILEWLKTEDGNAVHAFGSHGNMPTLFQGIYRTWAGMSICDLSMLTAVFSGRMSAYEPRLCLNIRYNFHGVAYAILEQSDYYGLYTKNKSKVPKYCYCIIDWSYESEKSVSKPGTIRFLSHEAQSKLDLHLEELDLLIKSGIEFTPVNNENQCFKQIEISYNNMGLSLSIRLDNNIDSLVLNNYIDRIVEFFAGTGTQNGVIPTEPPIVSYKNSIWEIYAEMK